MVARYRWLLVGVAVFSFCLGFALTISIWQGNSTFHSPLGVADERRAESSSTQEERHSSIGLGASEKAPSEPQLRLLSEADLVQTVVSDSGQVIDMATSTLPDELIGCTLDEVKSIHPEWRVVGFAPEKLTVRIPETQMEMLYGHLAFLGIAEGKVAAFRGKPGVYQRLVKVTAIPISSLPKFEVSNLEIGIPYSGDEELSLLLESLKEREE